MRSLQPLLSYLPASSRQEPDCHFTLTGVTRKANRLLDQNRPNFVGAVGVHRILPTSHVFFRQYQIIAG